MSDHLGADRLEVPGDDASPDLTAMGLPAVLRHDRGRPTVHPNGGCRS
ncbi:hypothetical protein [Streptomyces sp. NPDC057403]